jgi:hypothetical protein
MFEVKYCFSEKNLTQKQDFVVGNNNTHRVAEIYIKNVDLLVEFQKTRVGLTTTKVSPALA